MRIIKAPLRISIFGGGTDLPEYYEQHGSTIISMAIDKHIYLVHNPRPTGGYRLSYSNVEELGSLTTAKHTIIRQFAQDYGELEPCTLSIISDVPKGTGLGSSSALAVCAYELFRANRIGHHAETAHAAYQVERKVSNCGVQDHLPAAFGGFNVYTIGNDGRAKAEPVPAHLVEMVNEYGLLLYTGLSRPADVILKTWKNSINNLHESAASAETFVHFLNDGRMQTIDAFAEALEIAWLDKCKIKDVVNSCLSEQYRIARINGAIAGKLLGAGGGGCWFFLVHPELRRDIVSATGLVEVPFQIDPNGVQKTRF